MSKANEKRNFGEEIPKEILEICPYADPSCRLCRLPIEDLKQLHNLKFKKKWSLAKVNDYAKSLGMIGSDPKTFSDHFRRHVSVSKTTKLIKEKNTEVAKVLSSVEKSLTEGVIKSDRDVEKAYSILVRMVSDFTRRVEKLSKVAEAKLDDDKEYKGIIDSSNVLQLMTTISNLQKESVNQIKAISSLRTPKIVVAQAFKNFVDDAIRDISSLLIDTFSMIQDSVTQAVNNGGLNDGAFVKVFQRSASEFKNRMIMLQRDHIEKVSSALNEMEKVV